MNPADYEARKAAWGMQQHQIEIERATARPAETKLEKESMPPPAPLPARLGMTVDQKKRLLWGRGAVSTTGGSNDADISGSSIGSRSIIGGSITGDQSGIDRGGIDRGGSSSGGSASGSGGGTISWNGGGDGVCGGGSSGSRGDGDSSCNQHTALFALEDLPSSWKRVPSASRPGEFSYMHVPTGLKQKKFPGGDPSSDDIAAHFAALRKRAGSDSGSAGSSKRKKETRPLMKNESTASWHSYLEKKK